MNRTLLVIIVSVVLLIAVTLGILFSSEAPAYLPDDSPDGVAHNYLLALQNEEYQIAYGYLSTRLLSYPENEFAFKRNVENQWWLFRLNYSTTLSIESTDIRGNSAYVEVLETNYYQNGLFESSQSSNNFDLLLNLEDGEWKISDGDYYFANCWNDEDGCTN